MIIDILFGIIIVLMLLLLWLTNKIICELKDICNHLKGINSKKIIAIADEPEVRRRDDETEAAICDQMRGEI